MYALAPNLAWVVGEHHDPNDANIYLMLVPDGEPSIMNGPGAVIFLAVAAERDPLDAAVRVSGLPPETLADGVQGFLRDLAHRGFIVRAPEESTPGSP